MSWWRLDFRINSQFSHELPGSMDVPKHIPLMVIYQHRNKQQQTTNNKQQTTNKQQLQQNINKQTNPSKCQGACNTQLHFQPAIDLCHALHILHTCVLRNAAKIMKNKRHQDFWETWVADLGWFSCGMWNHQDFPWSKNPGYPPWNVIVGPIFRFFCCWFHGYLISQQNWKEDSPFANEFPIWKGPTSIAFSDWRVVSNINGNHDRTLGGWLSFDLLIKKSALNEHGTSRL